MFKTLRTISILIPFVIAAANAAEASYRITDLGTLGGSDSSAYGINNSGQVVGSSGITGDTAYHAFLYSKGTMQDLGTLGGTGSAALGINDSSQVVGWSFYPGESEDNGVLHGFLYSDGAMLDLNSLISDSSWDLISARGINDLGQIVGYGEHNSITTAFLMTPAGGPQPVKEPATILLLGVGFVLMWLSLRKT